ncbi:DNA repair ATPase [Nocardia coubleae]|uniref:DNA repair ATPase n=1 Tax=Nocardia coubleae TaxID=356147 RepID=A0A846WCF0_9NOCA|nr:DNA repair ATPase [Nocardia coubleae]NKX90346.1 DNA repair ATPase [Nocardia coubleae]
MSAPQTRHRDTTVGTDTTVPATGAALDGGTYEVLRTRLREQAAELAARCEELNNRRIENFGGIELALTGTEHIRTEHNCVPRDIVAVGDGRMLFGYNVFLGLKPQTEVDDVFAAHRFHHGGTEFAFSTAESTGLLDDPRFQRDFAELYRYYTQTRLLQLRRIDGRILAVFQTGQRTDDIKVLRWRVAATGEVGYLDNRGERDHVFPPPHEFTWVETTRDDQVPGRHPHLSVLGKVFVETLGGTLTVKVENNTEIGTGIYSEPVDEPLQSLADADVHYAEVGALILLRIRPYNETVWRHLVFNTRTRTVVRLDGIGLSCRLLPEDQGIVFPGGYYLETGVHKVFDTAVTDLEYERTVRAANGEDVLYVFHARSEGRSLLLPYNLIRKQVTTPITCHGYSLFDDGTMVVFRAISEEPTRVHTMQIWQTPFVADTHATRAPTGDTALSRIGNAELVRGISDCLSVTRMVADMAATTDVFEAVIAACVRTADHHHWLTDPEFGGLAESLSAVRATADQVVEEFAKVEARTAQAAAAVHEAGEQVATLVRTGGGHSSARGWVEELTALRRAAGQVETLRELRYVDPDRVDELAATVAAALDDASLRCVEFLSTADAFDDYVTSIAQVTQQAAEIGTVAEAAPIQEWLAEQTDGLQTVIEVVTGLEIGDATLRTGILERVATTLASANRARATVTARRSELAASEGRAEFAAEYALLGQAVSGALAATDSPEACDHQVSTLLSRIEGLETRFGAIDDFAEWIASSREDIYEAFAARKQHLLDDRAQRARRLLDSARRMLSTIERRSRTLSSADEVNGYFAADPMVLRLRTATSDLRAAGEVVAAEELDGRIKTARQEAGRVLRDRHDLYSDGGRTIRLGRHRFAVTTAEPELALVPHGDSLVFAVNGTDYREPLSAGEFGPDAAGLWSQLLVSENAQMYRGEFLATSILADVEGAPAGLERLHDAAAGGTLDALVRAVARQRYDEGYQLGVHDHDATLILDALLRMRAGAGLLHYRPVDRAAAQLWWQFGGPDWQPHDPQAHAGWTTRIRSTARAAEYFADPRARADTIEELTCAVGEFVERLALVDVDPSLAAGYLFQEIAQTPAGFVTAAPARHFCARFRKHLDAADPSAYADLRRDIASFDDDLPRRYHLVRTWLRAFAESRGDTELFEYLDEAVAIELGGDDMHRYDHEAELTTSVDGLLGEHPTLTGGSLPVRLAELTARAHRFRIETVPAFREHLRRRDALLAAQRQRLRLDDYKPAVLSGFVRNRLLDEVYLPLIGDNLARQLGTPAEAGGAVQSGLLLLISPPGYGKTTLMEYVAARLGLIFVKVDGPALGHAVRSLDPAAAPNATARREVEKIDFALELGNNVLLYLDDIQHTSPELLQKFISLCDAQRRMEGVWNGEARTYDLRGKRFAVCMAGNPYTEQGKRFRVPDMLANRADVWNLGEVLSGRDDLFALSYVENALTTNPVLAPLAARGRTDLELLLRLASGDDTARTDQLTHPYSPAELADIRSVLRKVLHVRAVVLAVNRAYIASAATTDTARTEPPFQLQGSYRDMNGLTSRIVSVMNDEELETLIDDHYRGEAQTLAAGAEANLLKLAELRGRVTPEQAVRWEQVKSAYVRELALGGSDDDALVRAVGGLGLLADRLGAVETAIRGIADSQPTGNHAAPRAWHRS